MANKVLILKTGQTVACLRQNGEDFEDWIVAGSGLGRACFDVLPVYAGARLPSPADCAAIIITGSPAFVTAHEAWSETAAEFTREAVAQGVPLLGICYGHQLLAYCLGGEVGFNPRGREIGTVDIDLTPAAGRDPLFASLPGRFRAQASHLQSVARLPPQAELLAASAVDPVHAFRVGTRAWGVQFHPEFSARVVGAYIDSRRASLLEEGLDPLRLLREVQETPQANSLLRRFLACAAITPTADQGAPLAR